MALHGERPSTLEPEQSAALQEKLLTALGNITSAESAAIWAQEALAAKNRLAWTDAKLVEEAFERRLSKLPSSMGYTPKRCFFAGSDCRAPGDHYRQSTDPGQRTASTKSILAVAAPRRYRSREHLLYVAQQACLSSAAEALGSPPLGFTQPARWPQGQR